MNALSLIHATENHPLIALFLALTAYLIGSIPFGLLLTKAAGMGDIREVGSGNIGATNVLRTGNKWLAALTLFLDAFKGFAAMALAFIVIPPLAPIAGFMAFIGHVFPIWLKFKGGKGVATYIGVAFGFSPIFAGVFCLIWLLVAGISRYSSLSAVVALFITPFVAFFLYVLDASIILGLMSMISILRHGSNLQRLLRGEESRIILRK